MFGPSKDAQAPSVYSVRLSTFPETPNTPLRPLGLGVEAGRFWIFLEFQRINTTAAKRPIAQAADPQLLTQWHAQAQEQGRSAGGSSLMNLPSQPRQNATAMATPAPRSMAEDDRFRTWEGWQRPFTPIHSLWCIAPAISEFYLSSIVKHSHHTLFSFHADQIYHKKGQTEWENFLTTH